jgi:hypothetical protein
VHFLYMGDQQHNNLIAKFSRLLITEESANSLPHIPSSDSRTWRYYAELPQIPSPFGRHTAAVNNLRDMLYEGPNLQAIGIHGGTDINIFRGTQKIVEWAGSARGDWTTRSADLMHRHFIRILDYLDGARFVQQDVPPGTALLVNSTIAQIPLLDVTADQNPRSYIDRLNDQLIGLIRAPGLTPQMHALAIQTQTALTKNLPFWLGKVRQDAKQLVMMNHTQLLQLSTLALLDDMLMQALYAFIGQLNPDTSQIQAGAVQIHYNVQRLATLDVKPYSGS